MRGRLLGVVLGLGAVSAVASAGGEAADGLDARDAAPRRIAWYGDAGASVTRAYVALPAAPPAGLVFPVETPPPPAGESPPAAHAVPLTYAVIEATEEPVLNGVRVVMRVRLSRDASESELRGIGDLIIQSESARRRLSAIALVYYLGGAAVADACAVGSAVWAPNGDWDATRTVRLGDYASHRHVVAGGVGTTRFPRECGADGRR